MNNGIIHREERKVHNVIVRVADPYTLYTDPDPDPDPAFQKKNGSGSGSSVLIAALLQNIFSLLLE